MEIIITGKDFDLTPSIKTFVEEHAKKLLHFDCAVDKVKFELDVDKRHHKGENCRVEVWAYVKGDVLSAGGRAADMRSAVLQVIHTVSRELDKRKEKRIGKRKRGK